MPEPYDSYCKKVNGVNTYDVFGSHRLRHTSATHQLAVGIELRQVQQNLRHKKLETTLIYSHVADSERHTAMKKMKKLK